MSRLLGLDRGDFPADLGAVIFSAKAVERQRYRDRLAGSERGLLGGHDEDAFFAKHLILLRDYADVDLERRNRAGALVIDLALDIHRDGAHAGGRLDGVVIGTDEVFTDVGKFG